MQNLLENPKENINRLLHREDLFPIRPLPSTFTEEETNLEIIIILVVIAMLFLVPMSELIKLNN